MDSNEEGGGGNSRRIKFHKYYGILGNMQEVIILILKYGVTTRNFMTEKKSKIFLKKKGYLQ